MDPIVLIFAMLVFVLIFLHGFIVFLSIEYRMSLWKFILLLLLVHSFVFLPLNLGYYSGMKKYYLGNAECIGTEETKVLCYDLESDKND
jgi:hypothetical protein